MVVFCQNIRIDELLEVVVAVGEGGREGGEGGGG